MRSFLGSFSLGAFAGVLSGLVGIGGGIIIVPALVYFFGMDQKTAQGTSLAVLLPPKPGVLKEGEKPGTLVATVTGAPLKSVLTVPMLAPRFTPTYQPVHTGGGGGAGGAFTAISAANADVPIKPLMATTQVASLFMAVPPERFV